MRNCDPTRLLCPFVTDAHAEISRLCAQLASARKALEPFSECVQNDGTVTENLCPADYKAARAALKDLP